MKFFVYIKKRFDSLNLTKDKIIKIIVYFLIFVSLIILLFLLIKSKTESKKLTEELNLYKQEINKLKEQSKEQLRDLNKKLETKKTENKSECNDKLIACAEDRALVISETQDNSYSFKNFGIYSPLLENKTYSETIYNYKNSTITNRTIDLDDKTYISLWEDTDDKFIKSFDSKGMITFDGYENFKSYPIYVNKDLEKEYKYPDEEFNKDYISTNNLNFRYFYIYMPRTPYGLCIGHQNSTSGTTKPIYIKICKSFQSEMFNSQEEVNLLQSYVQKTKKDLEQIAETFSYPWDQLH